mmetsp:Transcript_50755/g.135351  ORF Transcript_50755/g.135351 Transcript_50755/m.135351 type:complete len:216 (-) Transcript_50755:881-1528(-)
MRTSTCVSSVLRKVTGILGTGSALPVPLARKQSQPRPREHWWRCTYASPAMVAIRIPLWDSGIKIWSATWISVSVVSRREERRVCTGVACTAAALWTLHTQHRTVALACWRCMKTLRAQVAQRHQSLARVSRKMKPIMSLCASVVLRTGPSMAPGVECSATQQPMWSRRISELLVERPAWSTKGRWLCPSIKQNPEMLPNWLRVVRRQMCLSFPQ